ncbi:MAG: glucose-1-phosphate cytidylyltransferase [Bacteroidales bacterium]|jgi:glucose-1-phosphate cytidylyltransferase|nr:glucose-1-phosphate cytidylyltransferase [Bacteroidales bacterium]
MKVVIFAGGMGTRISEESHLKPKPMIEIGDKPILWHIMKIYSFYGFNEFIICLGYKGHIIKEYFINYFLYNSDVTIDLSSNEVEIHKCFSDNFKVTLVETGLETKTAGRLQRVQKYIGDEPFMLTYGDGVANININSLLEYHKEKGKIATVTAVQTEGKFGGMELSNNCDVEVFKEKPKGDGSWINGGFFVLEPKVFNYLKGDMDQVMWEDAPLETLAKDNQLTAYKHNDYWRCMDALRDKNVLEEAWKTNNAPWKIW